MEVVEQHWTVTGAEMSGKVGGKDGVEWEPLEVE